MDEAAVLGRRSYIVGALSSRALRSGPWDEEQLRAITSAATSAAKGFLDDRGEPVVTIVVIQRAGVMGLHAHILALVQPHLAARLRRHIRRAVARAAGVWSVSRRALLWSGDDFLIVRDVPGGMRDALAYMLRGVLAPGETVEAGGVVIAGDPDALPVAGRRVTMSQPAALLRWAERRAASPRAAHHRRKKKPPAAMRREAPREAAEGQQEAAPGMSKRAKKIA